MKRRIAKKIIKNAREGRCSYTAYQLRRAARRLTCEWLGWDCDGFSRFRKRKVAI